MASIIILRPFPFLIILLYLTPPGLGRNVQLSLEFTEAIGAPDGYEQKLMLINGQFPGPQITLDKGDTLIIEVINSMDKPFALHVHGVLNKDSIESDGAAFVTQNLIPPFSTFLLRPNVSTQCGTYIYHGHFEMDVTWAFGAIIIKGVDEKRIFQYSDERVILLTHIWHTPLSDLLQLVTAYDHVHMPPPKSVLFNGRSWGKWDDENDYDDLTSHSEGHGSGREGRLAGIQGGGHGGGHHMGHGGSPTGGQGGGHDMGHGGGHGHRRKRHGVSHHHHDENKVEAPRPIENPIITKQEGYVRLREGPRSKGYTVITVKPNKPYRFRVISLSAKFIQIFSIENHTNFQVMEVDGVLVDPVLTDRLELDSGQRCSILLKTDQPVGNYWMVVDGAPYAAPPNSRAILHYEGAPDPGPMRKMLFPGKPAAKPLSRWVLDQFHPHSKIPLSDNTVYPIPLEADREFILSYQMVASQKHNFTGFFVNGLLYQPSVNQSLFHRLMAGEDILTNPENGVKESFLGERIQVVFQGRYDFMGGCDHHPWHTHGHTFHVVGEGPDEYDPVLDRQKIDEKIEDMTRDGNNHPCIVRDVATLFPEQTVENTTEGAPCGWLAIRFVANNPGLWQIHCHVAAHIVMGKWFVLYEHEKGKLLD